jgi:hypothetical protein
MHTAFTERERERPKFYTAEITLALEYLHKQGAECTLNARKERERDSWRELPVSV